MFLFKEYMLLFAVLLFILKRYHFLQYFQHLDKVQLYYSLFIFLIFTANYPETTNSIFADASNSNNAYFQLLITPSEWFYNTMYLLFAKTLVELYIFKPKQNKLLNMSIVFYFVVLLVDVGSSLKNCCENSSIGCLFWVSLARMTAPSQLIQK